MDQAGKGETEQELLRRADAALAVRAESTLDDDIAAAHSRLRQLTYQRDLLVDDAVDRAAEEWAKTGPRRPRPWFGRWRVSDWQEERHSFVQAAGHDAAKRYTAKFLQYKGKDFDVLVQAALHEVERLKAERDAEIRAVRQELIEVAKALHHELRWSLDAIAARLKLDAWHLTPALGLLERRPRSRTSGGGGGGDIGGFYGGGYGGGDGGGDGGGGGE